MFVIDLNIDDFIQTHQTLAEKAIRQTRMAAAALATQTHAHILEQVNEKLHSRREHFIKALSFEEVDENTFIVKLDASANWIDDGLEPHEILDNLLKSPKAKTAKDGSKYVVVPFEHGKPPTQSTATANSLTQVIRAELKKQKIPYKKIETQADGSAKLGKLHSFSIMDKPLKAGDGPGQGHGPVGAVKQGMTGIPWLKNIRVYQKLIKDDKGKEKVQRSIMTFRVASSKHKGTGRWYHPGLEGKKFMEEGYKWGLDLWEKEAKPKLLADILNDA